MKKTLLLSVMIISGCAAPVYTETSAPSYNPAAADYCARKPESVLCHTDQ